MLDLLQLLAPAELPKVLDVLGQESVSSEGDFKSVFDSFLEADIEAKLEEGLVIDEDLLGKVLETLNDEQSSLLVSFLVQVEIAIEVPQTELAGLFKKEEQQVELENEIPGSAGFALRSLEIAFEFTSIQIEKGEWSNKEGIDQLSAYLKHWLKHEPCLRCSEPSFYTARELTPVEDLLQNLKPEQKILPEAKKTMDLYLVKTEKSNFNIPFFAKYKVEEVSTGPKKPVQDSLVNQAQVKPKEVQVEGAEDLLTHETRTSEEEPQLDPKLATQDKGVESKPLLEQRDSNRPSIHKEIPVEVPKLQTRVNQALDWFANQMEQIGQPEEMEDEEWSKILQWLRSNHGKSKGEAMEKLETIGQLKRLSANESKHARTLSEFQNLNDEVKEDELKTPSRQLRFQRALADTYQMVRQDETSEKAQEVLRHYKSEAPLPEGESTQIKREVSTTTSSETQAPSNAGLKNNEAKLDMPQTLPKNPTPPPAKGWDPEMLSKFLDSTKESLKIWVEKKYVAMRIQIEPADLGRIHLKTIVEQGRIGVLIQAENQMTKELLQMHLTDMKEILKEQGLEVAGFQVDIKEDSQNFSQQKKSNSAKFELETLLEDENDGAEFNSSVSKGLIDQVA